MIVEGRAIARTRAAEILGMSERNVYRLIRKGLLRRAPLGQDTGVLEDDVLAYVRARAERAASGPAELAVNQASLATMMARLQAVESRLAIVFRLLNIEAAPMTLTDPEALSLYRSATELAENGWSPFVEAQWAQTFVRVRIENLEQIERLTGDPHPWRVLHRLCATMLLVPYDKNLMNELSLGKANLFSLIGIWCQLKDVGPREMDALVAREALPRRRAINRATRGRSSPATAEDAAVTIDQVLDNPTAA